MSTVIFSLSFLILLALIVYAALRRWRKQHSFLSEPEAHRQIASPHSAGLFSPTPSDLARIEQEKRQRQRQEAHEKLLTWASLVDFAVLNDRPVFEKEELFDKSWNDAVEILTERARSEQDVRRLASFCLDYEFNVNNRLINAYQKIWAASPDWRITTDMFRLAAKADQAQTFLDVLNEAEQWIENGKLSDISAVELYKLAESHYWLLSQSSRTSGAGFLIREKMAELRRELTHR